MSNAESEFMKIVDPITSIRDVSTAEEDYTGEYKGIVVDNNDTEKYFGRCKVKVFGVFDDIQDSDIPWAIPRFTYIGSTVGSFVVPPLDTIVSVYFDGGNKYSPVYTNKIQDTTKLPNHIKEDYPNTQVIFQTDDDDSFRINTVQKDMIIEHSSGSSIRFDKDGSVHIRAKRIVDDSWCKSVPNGSIHGHQCALQIDPFTGQVHVSNGSINGSLEL